MSLLFKFDQTVSRLSKALFSCDPATTMCKENDAFDEYDRVASEICKRQLNGEPFGDALREVFFEDFDGLKLTTENISDIYAAFEKAQA